MPTKFLSLFKSRKKDTEPNIIRLIQNESIDSSLLSESDVDKLYVLNSLKNKRVLEKALTLLKIFKQDYNFHYCPISINGKNYWEFIRFA